MSEIQDPSSESKSYPQSEDNLSSLYRKNNQDNSIDFERIPQILIIHKWLFLSVAIIVMITAFWFALNQPKYYVSEYEVFYNEGNKEFAIESNVPVIKSNFDKGFWIGTMNSDYMARLIIKNSGLHLTTAMIKRLFLIEEKVKKEQSVPVYIVTITSRNNEIIPVLIKSFVRSLNDILASNQVASSKKLISFLTGQLNDNNKRMAKIDDELLHDESSNTALIHNKDKLQADLQTFRTDLLNSQITLSSSLAKKQRTEQELKNMDGTIVNESAFAEPLKVQLSNLQVDLARALTKYKEGHPAIKGIRDNIIQLQKMLRDSIQEKLEIKSLTQNPLKTQLMSKLMEADIDVVSLQSRVLSLQKVIAELELKMTPDSTNENAMRKIHSREMIGANIGMINSKLIEVQSAAEGSLSRFLIIDEPVVPTQPASKSKLLYLLIGFILAIILGCTAVYVYDLLDNRLKLVSDYSKFYSIPLLGVLLHKQKPEEYFSEQNPDKDSNRWLTEVGEIVVQIKKELRKPGKKLFSVCSPFRKEGKSTISLQLAHTLADKGLKVLLVDIDVFIPKLTTNLSMIEEVGLLNYVKGENSLEEVMHQTNNPNLRFTGVGSIDDKNSFHYDSPEFIKFINEVRDKFDIVIFDTPAILFIHDIVTFMEHIDGVVIIARLMHTTRKSLDKMLKMMGNQRTKITGTILNDLKLNTISRKNEYYHYEEGYNSYSSESKEKYSKKPLKRMDDVA